MIILLASFSNAQLKHYNDLWEKVEKLEIDGLPKSALDIVEQISEIAKKEDNASQLIKTMLFKSKFVLVLEEEAQLKVISDLKTEINNSKFPTKNVLESILANLYWQYFNQHRWQFYNRTKVAEKVTKTDFRTWDLQTLFNEIDSHFKNSLQNGLMLQLEPLSKYNEILNLQKDSKIYRPTVFDFLCHNALAFYKTNETHITKPAYKFEIDNPDFLADVNTFSEINIASKDSTSLQLNALKIYQDLIQFHLKDETPLALANVNIERLKFVNQHATFNDKETILLNALKAEKDKLKHHEIAALYDFEIAAIYFQQSKQYSNSLDDKNRWKAKDAITICSNVLGNFLESKGAEKCAILKRQIEQQELQITTEVYLPIQKDTRLLVSYKNLNSLQFNIYKLNKNQLEKFKNTYRKDEQLVFINNLKSYKTWKSKLRNENDYQTHTTEIIVPKLVNGLYLIVAKTSDNSESFAFANMQVTNMALVETETAQYKIFQVIDRNNGAPISNTNAELSYKSRNNRNLISKNYTTNNLGQIKIKKDNGWLRNVVVKVKGNNDIAYFGNYYISQNYKPQKERTHYKSFLFTDRSIYRPNQTVYFKSIIVKKNNGKSELLTNETIFATLHNTNGEKLSELDFETNEFGSISGEFILPNNGLNGQYYIEIYSTIGAIRENHYFSVEEYKRPKFETKFKPVTETFKINDSVTVKGNALAYAGSNITDAKVVYRVHRKVEYPRWYFWYRPWFNSEPQEIAHGESITNDKGEFDIIFNAQPDQSVDKSSLPIFNYEIIADVTDINGETRSATTIVKVGYHALTANMIIDEAVDKTRKDHKISIDTKNLNNEFVPAKGIIKIYKLKAPSSVLRKRPWAAPDYQTLSEEAFKNLFPYDAYKNEDNSNNWQKGALVFEEPFNTKDSKELKLGKIKNWESGQYIITLSSKDKFGQLVKDETRINLFSSQDKTLSDNQLFNISTDKPSYNSGDNALITIASAAQNVAVTIVIEKDRKIISTEIIQLNNNKKTISIPVTKEDMGGFVVHYSFAAFNGFKSGTQAISVPYPKTNLNIETTTFRDKLQPGTDETWNFKIKGPKGEQVSAELLASMYDASLDQFKSHSWVFNPINNPLYYSNNRSNANQSFGTQNFRVYQDRFRANYSRQSYDQLNWFGFSFRYNHSIRIRGNASVSNALSRRVAGVQIVSDEMEVQESVLMMESDDNLDEVVVVGYGEKSKKDSAKQLNAGEDLHDSILENEQDKPNFNNIKIRKNLQETAFFFPQLKTDEAGNVSFSFTTPEALTQWKLQLLAHTKTLESVTQSLTAITQKELMVIPNTPRFLREGDQITLSTKIANLTETQLSGQAVLILTDAVSVDNISQKLIINSNNSLPSGKMVKPERDFIVDAKGNTQVSWNLSIPDDVQAVQYKIIAKSEAFSDGEQNVLPVLYNRMLVTETLPMWVKSNQTKTFTLDKLKTNTSTTLKNHKLTLEMTSNPAWYAVQALPYLMEYPYECNEQTFSKYYANALASHIANSNPRIQEVFNQWRNTDALLSNLEKNQELKSILIQETPWLRDAQSETEQKKRIALLFDLNKMNNELQLAISKLKNNQMPSGGWSWFNGGYENRYITQHIITGFGHLKKLNVIQNNNEKSMIQKAINYLDNEFVKEYKDIRKYDANVNLNKDHLSYTQLHYLYMRSFYPEIKKPDEVIEISKYYQTQIQKYWLSRSLYSKGLMTLVSNRMNDSKTTSKILKSLKETSITTDELGMYWKSNTNSWYWYQAPIETQALLIEVFSETGSVIQSDAKNLETIDALKIWLLKNKQTNRWKTTKATTEAIYVLLLQGSDWLSVTDMVDVIIGGQKINPSKLEDVTVEAGTGYYKTAWNSSEIKPEMGTVTIAKKGNGIAWGSLYWQYFEDLDKITSADLPDGSQEHPLKLKKKLFLKKNTDTGEEISEINKNTQLKVGDLVRVRIELRSDRNMEFIHMKDMRASGLEPINVLSQYKWQDGLGYYESTKDASTNFFFDYLPKGIYVFEYDLRVNNAGNMSNGITTIQSMYAPEYSNHSEGTRITIK